MEYDIPRLERRVRKAFKDVLGIEPERIKVNCHGVTLDEYHNLSFEEASSDGHEWKTYGKARSFEITVFEP